MALKTIESKKTSPLFLEFNDFQKEAKFQNDTFYVLFVEDNPNQFDILTNWVGDVLAEHKVSKVVWYSARNLDTALAYIDEAEKKIGTRGYKGFDLIFCDLLIPKTKDRTEENIVNGFSAAQKIAERRWLAPVIGLSAYTDEVNVQNQKKLLRQKEFEIEGRPVFADFLAKGKEGFNPDHLELLPAKLRRHIIPLFHYAKEALNFRPDPTFFIGDEMLRILRQLVWLSRLESDSWRSLPKILLLGETGSGKTHLASTYHRFLQLRDEMRTASGMTRRPSEPVTINCASLTAFDLSGQIELFGARDNSQNLGVHRGNGIITQLGAFERATVYPSNNGFVRSSFAPLAVEPAYDEGGVVFFDEFANLHLTLQAGVLNTIEEGWIRRVLDGSTVRIGCHIVCATNADLSEIMRDTSKTDVGSLQMRKDLIDRIPYVIRVPSLRERKPVEILALLKRFASRSARAANVSEIMITPSAEEILFAAIDKNIVTSIRHLQTIARLQPGEDIISDSNLRWVIEKARLLKVKSLLGASGELTIAEKAKAIGLKEWLCVKSLPEYTAWAVEQLYNVHKDPERHQAPNFQEIQFQTTEGQEWEWRYWLLSAYFNNEVTAVKLYQSRKAIFNSRRNQARRKFGFEGDARKDRKEIENFDRDILLSLKPRVR